jgi:hypothetical protein
MDGAGQEPESEQEEDDEVELPALKEESCFLTLSELHSGQLGTGSFNLLCK